MKIKQLLIEHQKERGPIRKAWDFAKGAALAGLGGYGLYKVMKNPAILGQVASGAKSLVNRGLRIPGAARIGQSLSGQLAGLLSAVESSRAALDADPNNPGLLRAFADAQENFASAKEKESANSAALNDLQTQNPIQESGQIKRFIQALGEKNYSHADKYLKRVVERKLHSRIKDQYNTQRLY